MSGFSILFELPQWLILICAAVGLLYAYLLYRDKRRPWGKTVNGLLFTIRAVLVFLLALFLLGPFIKYISNIYEDPLLIFAVDNSESIVLAKDSTEIYNTYSSVVSGISDLEEGYKIEYVDINAETFENVEFNDKLTNLHTLLKSIETKYQGRNVSDIVLLSDGIYNSGISPLFNTYNFKVHTLAWGDTIPKEDVRIQRLRYNKVAYQGNKFPIVADVSAEGLDNVVVNVSLLKNGEVIDVARADLSGDDFEEVSFLTDANESGLQRYTVTVETLDGEFNTRNNRENAIIDIVDGKENILMFAASPHPDIKAIRSAIEVNPNYRLDVFVGDFIKPDSTAGKYDLAILHKTTMEELRNKLPGLPLIDDTPVLFINVDPGRNQEYNNSNGVLEVLGKPGQKDLVTAVYNTAFSPFNYSRELAGLLEDLPPVIVPFGAYNPKPSTETLLFQRVGSIETGKPLMVFNTEIPKRGIMAGDGLWRWKLYNFQQNKNNDLFNELILKPVQYLSSREDKRKFKVYPLKVTNINQPIMETEVYNDLFERIYGNEIQLKVTGEDGNERNYTFSTSAGNTRFIVRDTEPGIYTYMATTTLNGQRETSSGEFIVSESNREAVNLKADYNLLRSLAGRQNGKFYRVEDYMTLVSELQESEPTVKIHTTERYSSLVSFPWFFVLLIVLASVEWFLRKYMGGY